MEKSTVVKHKGVSTAGIKTLITSLSLAAALGFWSWFSNQAQLTSTASVENFTGASNGQSVVVNGMSDPPFDPSILGASQPPLRQVTLPAPGSASQNTPFINNLHLAVNSLLGNAGLNNGGRRDIIARPDVAARTGSSRR